MKRHRSRNTMPAVDLRVIAASASGAAAIVCGAMISGITPAHTEPGSAGNQPVPSQHAPSHSVSAEATHDEKKPQE